MENVLVKEVERLLQTNYHIYMNIEEANDCQRYQIIGNNYLKCNTAVDPFAEDILRQEKCEFDLIPY